MNAAAGNSALEAIVLEALAPCPHFSDACAGCARWDPARGFIPRGFLGAAPSPDTPRLVLALPEPGEPVTGEVYSGTPPELFEAVTARARAALEDAPSNAAARPYHRNLRKILDAFWPAAGLGEQLAKTWIAPAVLCSSSAPRGSVPRRMEAACLRAYFRREMEALGDVFIVTLGARACERLERGGISPDFVAQHPSARPITRPERSWIASAAAFRTWLKGRTG